MFEGTDSIAFVLLQQQKKKTPFHRSKIPPNQNPRNSPPQKKKETNPRFPEAFTSSSSSFFLLLLLPEISRERNRRPRARDRGALLFLCLSERFVWLSFFLEIFGFWSLGDFKFFFLIVEILNSRSWSVDLFGRIRREVGAFVAGFDWVGGLGGQ